jgi:prepilin-type N-terminal cleavage/methylation domain-containing protein
MNRRATRQRGFTLIEVMIVVVIVGVLSTLAVYGVMGYLRAAKMSEAPEMLHAIKAAQESYKDETFSYLSVSPDLDTLYPTKKSDLGSSKKQWGSEADGKDILDNFKTLGVSPGAPLYFGYACIAGNCGESTSGKVTDVSADLNYPASPAGPWYIAKAMADVDGDGTYSVFVTSSFTDEIYSEEE